MKMKANPQTSLYEFRRALAKTEQDIALPEDAAYYDRLHDKIMAGLNAPREAVTRPATRPPAALWYQRSQRLWQSFLGGGLSGLAIWACIQASLMSPPSTAQSATSEVARKITNQVRIPTSGRRGT